MLSDLSWLSFRRLTHLNLVLLVLTILLGLSGVVMMYSAAGGNWQPWANRHALRLLLGLGLMLVVAIIPLHFWFRSSWLLYGGGLLLLMATTEPIAPVRMGAQRWLEIGGFSIQPSEFMKLAVILVLARYFHQLHPMDQHRIPWMIPPLLIIGVPVGLILLQPNLGTATILTGISLAIWFAGGLQWRYLIVCIAGAAAAAPVGWHFLHDYQKQRILTFLDPEADPLGAGYNILQSMIAIGSGGLSGRGFLHGSQGQLDFLPEKHTDFIFTMVAEEFGFIGSITLLAFLGLLILYGIGISLHSRHRFGALIAVGVTAMLWLHIMINMAMLMGLIPVVGVPLPFLSYGGTMQLSTLIAVGLLQNVFLNRDITFQRNP